MAIDLVTEYLPYVDEIFTQESKKSMLTNNDFAFEGASKVRLYKISTSDMNDYGRQGPEAGYWSRYGAIRNLNATTEEATLKKDRSFTFVIDKLDENQTGGALSGATALARQIREVAIPEVDSYTYDIMASGAGIKPAAVTLTVDNIYDQIITASAELDDALVPAEGRVLTVTPQIYRLMKKSKEIILDTEIGADMRKKGIIANLDGAAVVKIPSARLPKNFGFMLSHKSACCAPTQLADYRTHQDPPGISGTLVEGRVVYDAYVFENKAKGIYYQANKAAAESA